jgi:phosphoserine aminotransferase
MERVWNFSAGPATLPESVLERAREELLCFEDSGMSVLEMSHRSRWFAAIIEEAEQNLRGLLSLPEDFKVLFLQGGASLQFTMIPMNLLGDAEAAYVVGGSWAKKALSEARKVGAAAAVWDGSEDGFRALPDLSALEVPETAAYLHLTSNETIQGVEYPPDFEPSSGPPLVVDGSSNFLSRPLPMGRYGMLYAGAQKNAGPAGLTIVLIRKEILGRVPDGLPAMLDYRVQAESGSLYNTPPAFPIYIFMLVTRWIRDEIGGLDHMHARNLDKASALYSCIDESEGFYRGHAAAEFRSDMNVTFRLPTEDLEKAFVAEAASEGFLELKGHRSVGGCRASIYNAMPPEGVEALRDFMEGFALRNG